MNMNTPILSDNRTQPALRYNNLHFYLKTPGKVSALFRCSTAKCYASLSLKVDKNTQVIKEPLEVIQTNDKHIETCNAKVEEFFETRDFMTTVKKNLNIKSQRIEIEKLN